MYEFPVLYDILHTPGTAQEVDGLQRLERRFVPKALLRAPKRRWLEPACGTARYLRVAAGRGIRVAGFDSSPDMIRDARARLRARGFKGDLFVADMAAFAPRAKASFAFCTINTIRHLMSDAALLAHLRCMARALAPGGVYAVGIETSRYGIDFPAEDVWHGARGRTHVTQVVQYTPPTRARRLERVTSHLSVQTPSGTRSEDTGYWLRAYSHRQWATVVAKARWDVLGLCAPTGDDALLGPRGHPIGGYAIWVLRPRASAGRAG